MAGRIPEPRASDTPFPARSGKLDQGLLMQFKDRETENVFRDVYVFRRTTFTLIAMLASGVLFYVFFIWDQIIDPEHYGVSHAIRGLIFVPIVVLLTALVAMPATRKFTEIWLTLLYVIAALLLCVIYSVLTDGWKVGAVGLVLVCFCAGNMFDMRLPYYLFGGVCCLIFMNVFMAFSIPLSGLWLVNNMCVVSAVAMSILGAGYREHGARNNFKLQRALATAQTRVGDLEYAIAHSAGKTMERRVFISYRRSDSEAVSGRIRDRLAAHFGAQQIFMDIDNIPIGVDYRTHIRGVITGSDAIIAVIGQGWVARKADDTLRIDEANDPIRMELELAFDDGVPVLPVLIGSATMPTPEELPQSLSTLSYLNAAPVDPGRDFHIHLDRLIDAISQTKVRSIG